jgi:hypothetical protein
MELLCADYGSGSEEEVEEIKGNSEQYQQEQQQLKEHCFFVDYSKGDRVMYMNTEECIVIEKHMVALFTNCRDVI